jgi:integrase
MPRGGDAGAKLEEGSTLMAVRKRTWTTRKGERREAWAVAYTDQSGARRLKTFERMREAVAFEATAAVEVRAGLHVPDSVSVTVEAAGKLWLETGKVAGLEATTLNQYRQHLNLHLVPFIGGLKLTALSVPVVRAFEDQLRAEGRSPAMVRKVLVSLGSLLADAQERGLVARNVVRDLRGGRKGKERRQDARHKGRLKVGKDIPSPTEIKAFVGALQGRWRPLLLTAVFTGCRASELRGLRWADVDLERRTITISQRADAAGEIGSPKSASGARTLPIPPLVANSLKEWSIACPKGPLGLVFPNPSGQVQAYKLIRDLGLIPTWVRAGISVAKLDEKGQPVVDKEGEPILTARYPGLHALRHFYASWLINPTSAGGLGLPLKVVSERLGHSSIRLTADVYGHLFPTDDDSEQMAAAERALLG